eukprot:gene35697-46307_t
MIPEGFRHNSGLQESEYKRQRVSPVTIHKGDIGEAIKCCYICLESNISDPVTVVSCLHQFCFDCLFTWLVIKENCPVCKATVESIIRNKLLPSSSDSSVDADDGNVEILRLKGNDEHEGPGQGAEETAKKRKASEEEDEKGGPARVDYNSLNQQLTRAISFHRSRKRLEVEQQRQQAQPVALTCHPADHVVEPLG